jgi:phage/plasmid primase-like uncharacterized protein
MHYSSDEIREIEEAFSAALAEQGFGDVYIPADGEWHRFAFPDDDEKEHGSAVLSIKGSRISGAVTDWRQGPKPIFKWKGPPDDDLTPAEKAKKKAAQQEEVRLESLQLWNAAPSASNDHPYLKRKGLTNNSGALKQDGADLVIPIWSVATDCEFQGIQRISPDGEKRFPPGTVIKGGCAIPWEYDRFDRIAGSKSSPIVFVEGYSDAASIYACGAGLPLACFGHQNFMAVVKAARNRWPLRDRIVAADNDPGNPKTLENARAAAREAFAKVAVPSLKDFNDVLVQLGKEEVKRQIAAAELPPPAPTPPIAIVDFRAYMPQHKYIFLPTGDLWPAESVNARLPLVDDGGEGIKPTLWLDQNAAVEQMTWLPGEPEFIRDRVVAETGFIERKGIIVYNLYRPPPKLSGDASKAQQWRDHLKKLYPDDAGHVEMWFAHNVQRPEVKIDHALLFTGAQGIGKDSIIEPVKETVGAWNSRDVSPHHVLTMDEKRNDFLQCSLLRINEIRDLGESNRYVFYERLKYITTAVTFRINKKYIQEYIIPSRVNVVMTSNHHIEGIYLPPDDRHVYVAHSTLAITDFEPGYFEKLWKFYLDGGFGHVAAYLASLDISSFDAKAPPPKTKAFCDIVAANSMPEDNVLRDVIEELGSPEAITVSMIESKLSESIGRTEDENAAAWLGDRKNYRLIPKQLEACGYSRCSNPHAGDGFWKIAGRRTHVYVRRGVEKPLEAAAARKKSIEEEVAKLKAARAGQYPR